MKIISYHVKIQACMYYNKNKARYFDQKCLVAYT